MSLKGLGELVVSLSPLCVVVEGGEGFTKCILFPQQLCKDDAVNKWNQKENSNAVQLFSL